MSAWTLNKREIDVLVHWLYKTGVSNALPDSLGAMLWSENYKSVRARYGDYDREGRFIRRPSYQYATPKVTMTSRGEFDPDNPDQALKMVRFYDYQSCEHPGWDRSKARRLMDKLEKELLRLGADWQKEGLLWGM